MGDLDPPLAWELHSKEDPRGDATWFGGRRLELNTGPALKGILESELAPILDMPGAGELLTDYFAALRTISRGAVWAEPVPRDVVMSVLSGGAKYQRNEFPLGVDPGTLLAWTISGKLTWEVSAKSLPGQLPAFKAGGTLQGRECWLVLGSRADDPKLTFLGITSGPMEMPRLVEQRDRLFRRSVLGQLLDHLQATVTAPPAGGDQESYDQSYGYPAWRRVACACVGGATWAQTTPDPIPAAGASRSTAIGTSTATSHAAAAWSCSPRPSTRSTRSSRRSGRTASSPPRCSTLSPTRPPTTTATGSSTSPI